MTRDVGANKACRRGVTERSFSPSSCNTSARVISARVFPGLFNAATAVKLAKQGTDKAGFGTACQAVGYQYLLGQLKNFLPVKVTVTDF